MFKCPSVNTCIIAWSVANTEKGYKIDKDITGPETAVSPLFKNLVWPSFQQGLFWSGP